MARRTCFDSDENQQNQFVVSRIIMINDYCEAAAVLLLIELVNTCATHGTQLHMAYI